MKNNAERYQRRNRGNVENATFETLIGLRNFRRVFSRWNFDEQLCVHLNDRIQRRVTTDTCQLMRFQSVRKTPVIDQMHAYRTDLRMRYLENEIFDTILPFYIFVLFLFHWYREFWLMVYTRSYCTYIHYILLYRTRSRIYTAPPFVPKHIRLLRSIFATLNRRERATIRRE